MIEGVEERRSSFLFSMATKSVIFSKKAALSISLLEN